MSNRNPRPLRTPEDRRQPMETRDFWSSLACPYCGGRLSEPRLQNGKRWLHCFSCHFEFQLASEDDVDAIE